MVPSEPHDASSLPLAEKHKQSTALVWPRSRVWIWKDVGVQDLDDVVAQGHGQQQAVRRKAAAAPSAQGFAFLSGIEFPEQNGLVVATDGQGLAVGGKG